MATKPHNGLNTDARPVVGQSLRHSTSKRFARQEMREVVLPRGNAQGPQSPGRGQAPLHPIRVNLVVCYWANRAAVWIVSMSAGALSVRTRTILGNRRANPLLCRSLR